MCRETITLEIDAQRALALPAPQVFCLLSPCARHVSEEVWMILAPALGTTADAPWSQASSFLA